MVTKKRRRSQLVRATSRRRQSRRARAQARRRQLRLVAIAVAVLAALAALVAWIMTHTGGTASARTVGVDYALVIEPSQHQAATTGEFR